MHDHEPSQHVEPENPLEAITLGDLPQALQDAARRAGWASLMPVQSKSIPYIRAGRDLMIQARTGSGKTGAFVLPILERIDRSKAQCQALVLVPTRELAIQVGREAKMLAEGMGINTVVVYGGVGYGKQIEGFQKGAHVVVGTPGRILDHLLKRSLVLDHLRIMVFDEADRMMSMGFYPDMKELRRHLPRKRDGYMFSATFLSSVRSLAREFLCEPGFLSLSRDNVHIADMDHIYYLVPPMDKDRCLVRIIEMENPASAIIFCNTKVSVNYVAVVLQRFGYDADQLSADLSQRDRERVLTRLRGKTLRFLVATDVAARGIDIADLSHVILYEFPDDPESYIHRAGRTARAGAGGVAISLVAGKEQLELGHVTKRFSITMEKREVPTDEDVQAIVSERVTAMLEAKLRNRDRLEAERMQRMIPLARTFGESEEELAIVAMLLDDYYQESLHAPPAFPDPVIVVEPSPRKKSDAPKKRRRRGGTSKGKSAS